MILVLRAVIPVFRWQVSCLPNPRQGTRTIADRVANLRKLDGFAPLYWDEASGRLLLEIPGIDRELLYQVSLAAGVGSNLVGLDRGAGRPIRRRPIRARRTPARVRRCASRVASSLLAPNG
jgi:hypothetical protein